MSRVIQGIYLVSRSDSTCTRIIAMQDRQADCYRLKHGPGRGIAHANVSRDKPQTCEERKTTLIR